MNLPAIAQKTNANISHVERIVNNKENRVIKIGYQKAYFEIYDTLVSIFPLYGIDGPKEMYMEVSDYLARNFKLISPEEVRTAFELFSSDMLDLDEDVKFYGKINVHTLGKVINAYILWRNKITYLIEKEKQDKIDEDIRQNKLAENHKEYLKNFDSKLAAFHSNDYNDIPVFWYDICNRLGYLHWEDGEKERLWEMAKELAKKEVPNTDNVYEKRSLMKKIEQGNLPRAKVIAYQLAVYKKVIKLEKI